MITNNLRLPYQTATCLPICQTNSAFTNGGGTGATDWVDSNLDGRADGLSDVGVAATKTIGSDVYGNYQKYEYVSANNYGFYNTTLFTVVPNYVLYDFYLKSNVIVSLSAGFADTIKVIPSTGGVWKRITAIKNITTTTGKGFVFQSSNSTQAGDYFQISKLNIQPQSLFIGYKLNNDIADFSGNGLTGTGTYITYTSGVYGIANSAALFNGTTSKIVVSPASLGTLLGNDFSMSGWFYSTAATPNNDVVIAINDNTTNLKRILIRINSSNQLELAAGYSITNPNILTYTGFVINKWFHYAINVNVDTAYLWINGVYIGSVNVGTPLPAAPTFNQISLGARFIFSWTGFFSGRIDYTTVFNRPLTQAEILTLYLLQPSEI